LKETKIVPLVEKLPDDYVYDYCEEIVPRIPGFITDFVYSLRGYECPTIFCVWTALSIISTAVHRNAWIKWCYDKVYPNLYITIVGPNGEVAKGTAINHGFKILELMQDFFFKDDISGKHIMQLISTKITQERLQSVLVPGHLNKEGKRIDWITPKDADGKPLIGIDGKQIKIYLNSEALIYIPEMATMLGKQKYNEGMTDVLLDIYDCHDTRPVETMGRGKEIMRNVFINLLAATTPVALSENLPKSILGDGFLSRTIMVYAGKTKKCFPEPIQYKGAPDRMALAGRLAYIAKHGMGEYYFSPDARLYYNDWYRKNKEMIAQDKRLAGAKSRVKMHFIKLALLLKAQSYTDDKEIDLECVKEAARILAITYKFLPHLIFQVGDEYWKEYYRFCQYMMSRVTIKRSDLVKNLRIKSEALNYLLKQAMQEGRIKVVDIDSNEEINYLSGGDENYVWTGETEEAWNESKDFAATDDDDGKEDYTDLFRKEERKGRGRPAGTSSKHDRKVPEAGGDQNKAGQSPSEEEDLEG
jgi:hypothetical protein